MSRERITLLLFPLLLKTRRRWNTLRASENKQKESKTVKLNVLIKLRAFLFFDIPNRNN